MRKIMLCLLVALIIHVLTGTIVSAQGPVWPTYNNTWSTGSWQSGVYNSGYGYQQGWYHTQNAYGAIAGASQQGTNYYTNVYNQANQFVQDNGGLGWGGFDQGALDTVQDFAGW